MKWHVIVKIFLIALWIIAIVIGIKTDFNEHSQSLLVAAMVALLLESRMKD